MDIFAPINWFADIVTYSLLGLAPLSYWGEAVNFFIYDVIKIGILLVLINMLMAVTRYYFPMEKVRDILTKRRWFGMDYLLAAILGVVTPFCSCSSIPLFIGFLSAGIPIGVTFAFLISSPLVNEASLFIFPAMFGVQTTVLYNLIGIGVSMAGGYVIQKLAMERFVFKELLSFKARKQIEADNGGQTLVWRKLVNYWFEDAMKITREVFPYVVVGVGIGALIHGFVPQSLVERYLAVESIWVVPLAVVLGAPLYANSVSVIPVIEALAGKGVPLGTGLAFMTSVVTLSIPQALILKKVMKWQLLAMFFGITLVGIIFMGYFFNAIL
jgi:uncharacterized protein